MNTKQIVAILVVIALAGAGVIGLGYAYNTSTQNTSNVAPETYLMADQAVYTSSFDDNTFIYNTTHNDTDMYTYAFGDVVSQINQRISETDYKAGDIVTNAVKAYYHQTDEGVGTINSTAASATATVYKLGEEVLTLGSMNMTTLPQIYLKVQATGGLAYGATAPISYYIDVKQTSGSATNFNEARLFTVQNNTSSDMLTFELNAIDELDDEPAGDSVDVRAVYTVSLYAVTAASLTSAVEPLDNATFKMQFSTDTAALA